MMKKYFSGRATRADFLIYAAVPILFLNILVFFVNASDNQKQYDERASITGLFALVLLPPIISATIKRFHDLNKSGWYGILMIIPIVSTITTAWLALQKGDEKDNKYGKNPYTKQRSRE